MPRKGKPIIILDRYMLTQIARYPSIRLASEDLGIPMSSIYTSICQRTAVYDSYFIYEREFKNWQPAEHAWRRVNGTQSSEKLEELRKQSLGS